MVLFLPVGRGVGQLELHVLKAFNVVSVYSATLKRQLMPKLMAAEPNPSFSFLPLVLGHN